MPSATSSGTSASVVSATGKKRGRGSYNCGRCGLPKKGHICHIPAQPAESAITPSTAPRSVVVSRRALSFDEDVVEVSNLTRKVEVGEEGGEMVGEIRRSSLVDVMRRLPPKELMIVAGVCKGWRDCVRRVWKSTTGLRLLVPAKAQIGFVGSVLQRCGDLISLSLRMESDFDATILACIAFSCTNLEKLEITTVNNAVNRIHGSELSRFVAEKRSLTTLTIEGCTNLGFLKLSSSSLLTLWLSNLYCISNTVINCPNLKELSFDFSRNGNDTTDLTIMLENLGHTCPRLRNIHIASIHLCNSAVLALADANLRGLRMIALLLGSKMTDSSVTAIVQSYKHLEFLDLSGSSISDSGISMICNAFPNTLTSLLLAFCPNITSSGIQFATAQLPFLRVIDCGMSMCDDVSSETETFQECGSNKNEDINDAKSFQKLHPIYQKLIIKHGRLKKLSLWSCSGLNALYLNCPDLRDLNLNSCTNLNPEKLLLQCSSLEKVHASGCQDLLTAAIQSQIQNEFSSGDNNPQPCKRLPDSSKRVLVPDFLGEQSSDEKVSKRLRRSNCTVQF